MSRSFAPGHVTGIFAPALDAADPRARGSLGAGVVLEAGVRATARFDPTGRRRVAVRSDLGIPLPISLEVARRLFGSRSGSLRVDLRHELPVGQGFGMSAAGALATGIAVSAALGLPEQKGVEVAHLADLFGGGGLGGVSAILEGGLEIRERPGIPPFGRVRHARFDPPLLLSVVGAPIPSPSLLRNPAFLARVRSAAESAWPRLVAHPDAPTFLQASERFTDSIRLGPPTLRRLIPALRSSGARVAQAMLGRSLFSVPRSPTARSRLLRELERRRIPTIELRASRTGARTLPARTERAR